MSRPAPSPRPAGRRGAELLPVVATFGAVALLVAGLVELAAGGGPLAGPARVAAGAVSADYPSVDEGDSGTQSVRVLLYGVDIASQGRPFAYTRDGSATAAGGDYGAVDEGLVICTDSSCAIQQFTVSIGGDNAVEDDEIFYIDFIATFRGGTLLATAVVTIVNDDSADEPSPSPAPSTVGNVSVTEPDTDGVNVQISVPGPIPTGTFVTFSTGDGTATAADGDYEALSAGRGFCPGVRDDGGPPCSSVFVNVTVFGDRDVEPNEVFYVTVEGRGTSSVTILNDDEAAETSPTPPPTEPQDVAVTEPDSGAVTARISVPGPFPDFEGVTSYSTRDGSATVADGDYQPVDGGMGPCVFTGGECEGVVVNVQVNGDERIEGDETFTVEIPGRRTVTVTILDDDVPNQAPFVSGPATRAATEDTPVTVRFTATDPDGDALTWSVSDPAHGTASIPQRGSTLLYQGDRDYAGQDTVVVTVTDPEGLSASTELTITIAAVDDDPRVFDEATIPCPAAIAATGPGGAIVAYTPPAASDPDGGALTVACDPAPGSRFPLGPTGVTCTATDTTGRTDTVSFTITVADRTAPVITLAQDAYRFTTNAPDGEILTFPPPTATDAVDGPTPATCEPPAGDRYPLGTTTVACTATDRAGNVGRASFTVTVNDEEPPVLGALPGVPAPPGGAAATVLVTEATAPMTVVSWPAVTAGDSVAGRLTATCRPASGGAFPLGDTLVTCTAEDGSDNRVSGTFLVRVTDTVAPTLTLPPGVTVKATGPGGAMATFTATATDAADPAVPLGCDPPSGSLFPLGRTTVRCTATDDTGNPASATFTVTVCDTTAPAIAPTGGVQDGRTYARRNLPPAPACAATDIVDGPVACAVTGYETGFGDHTITSTATDAAGNTVEARVTYSVAERVVGPTATPRPTSTPAPPTVTPRPRLNPTATPIPIPIPSEPTARPTPRPRGPTATPIPPGAVDPQAGPTTPATPVP